MTGIATNARLARAIETDRAYFELAARSDALHGARLVWMDELAAMPAGAVVQRIEARAPNASWIEQVEGALLRIGARMARIYPDHAVDEDLFRGAGYDDRDELFFTSHSIPEAPPGFALRPLITERDWHDKLRFQLESGQTPDGHPNAPADWTELERRKCEHGMEAFLIETEGVAVGTIGAIWFDQLLRLKNFIVHPDHRRRRVGQTTLSLMADLGRSRGVSELCVVAVRGEPGEQLYRKCGMTMVGTQVEWSRRFESD